MIEIFVKLIEWRKGIALFIAGKNGREAIEMPAYLSGWNDAKNGAFLGNDTGETVDLPINHDVSIRSIETSYYFSFSQTVSGWENFKRLQKDVSNFALKMSEIIVFKNKNGQEINCSVALALILCMEHYKIDIAENKKELLNFSVHED